MPKSRSLGSRTKTLAAAVVVLAAGMGLVSCGNSDEGSATTTAADTPSTTAKSSETTTTAEVAVDVGVNVKVASTGVGEVLSDGQGRVFYIFTPDGTGAATCVDACAAAWPPVLTEGGVVADAAVSKLKLGSTGQGASEQLTIEGQPVYFFASDTEPGSASGQAAGGKWFVLNTDGVAVQP
jgi:predicted lipoprotein with Yx(FWY)xxD motif